MTLLDLATSMTPTPKPPRSVSLRILVIAVSVAVILSLAGIFISYRHAGRLPGPLERLNPAPLSKAVQAGKQFAGGHCSGTKLKKLNHLPIYASNNTKVQTYRLVVGCHCIEISK